MEKGLQYVCVCNAYYYTAPRASMIRAALPSLFVHCMGGKLLSFSAAAGTISVLIPKLGDHLRPLLSCVH